MLLRLAYVSWKNVFFFFLVKEKIGTKKNIFKRRYGFFCQAIADVATKNNWHISIWFNILTLNMPTGQTVCHVTIFR